MPFGYIYKIVFPNGKHYIGLTTTSLEQRTKEHKKYAKSDNTRYLYNALRKYDMVDTLELIEIDTADTKEELCEKEIGYILLYNSYYMNGNGYNMTYGGEGICGYVFTEEDNQKNSERGKKYYEENPDAREKQSEIKKKYFENPEAREKQSKIKKQYYQEHPEEIQKNREAQQKYYKENPEAGKEQGEKMKQYYKENPEAGKEHGEKMKQYYKENPEAGKKQGEKMKQYYKENPEAGKEHGEKIKQYYKENPEAGKKQGEKMKQYYKENPEAREKNRKARQKYFENNPEARQKLLDGKGKNNPFDVFKTDGTFIKSFTYQFDAKEYLQTEYNITSTLKISAVLAGNRKSSAGFVFKYK